MALDRSKYKQRIAEKTKEVADKGSGSNFKTIFKPNLGDAVKFFKPKAGAHSLDIIPFEAAAFMPIDNKSPEGDIAYLVDVYVHFNVGPQKDSYICMAKSYGQQCAVCDFITEETRKESTPERQKLVKSIKPKQRALYYVIVYDSPEEEKKGLQIWNAPHWKMQRIINELALIPERGGVKVGGYIPYGDPDNGKTIGFKIVGEQESTDYIGHRFIDRDYIIEDKFLIQANQFPLDSLLYLPEYKEVQSALFGFGAAQEEKPAEEKPATQNDLPLPTESANDPAPATGDDSPAATSCPGAGKFGVDIDQIRDCGECEIYEACSAEETRLSEQRKAERAKKKLERKTA